MQLFLILTLWTATVLFAALLGAWSEYLRHATYVSLWGYAKDRWVALEIFR